MHYFSCLTIGSELLDGRIVDTNSRYLAKKLWSYGYRLNQILTCNDTIPEIVKALTYLKTFSNLVIITGGLGPTEDDLTREAVASFLNVSLKEDTDSLSKLKQFFANRGREMSPSNRKQALFPDGAVIIPNENGTAPGFLVANIAAFPGVPAELYPMIENKFIPLITQKGNSSYLNKATLRVFDIPESVLNEKIRNIDFSAETEIAFQVKYPEVIIQVVSANDVNLEILKIKEILPSDKIISDNETNGLAEVVIEHLSKSKQTLITYEKFTSGQLSFALLDSSSSINTKRLIKCCNIDNYTDLNTNNSESEVSLALSLKDRFRADIAIVLIYDIKNSTEQLHYFESFIIMSGETIKFQFQFKGDVNRCKLYSASKILDNLRRMMLRLHISEATL
jgi:nicotinamide-nucleotide amidase